MCIDVIFTMVVISLLEQISFRSFWVHYKYSTITIASVRSNRTKAPAILLIDVIQHVVNVILHQTRWNFRSISPVTKQLPRTRDAGGEDAEGGEVVRDWMGLLP